MIYDVIIIGAGAAGLMTAITAKRSGIPKVLLLDAKSKIGAKILMSGGTRCNLTNEKVTDRDFCTQQKNILKSVLQYFPSDKAVQFFNELGVETVTEEGGKYFPMTHSGRTVLEALEKEIRRLEIDLQAGKKVTALKFKDGLFELSGEGFTEQAKNVVLTTGGLSFPATGSDGTGYQLAAGFGHKILKTFPSLTPLVSEDKIFQSLSGLSLNAELSLWENGKKGIAFTGSFLFTHFGYSGPVALNISRHWIEAHDRNPKAEICADFYPGFGENVFRERFLDEVSYDPGRTVKNFLGEGFPERFIEAVLKKAAIPTTLTFNQLRKENRDHLLQLLFRCPLGVTATLGYEKAEVTAGGVDLAEVHRKTLESKLQPGLYFAGEILDADGRIGGFNFQWAWSSGVVVGKALADKIVK